MGVGDVSRIHGCGGKARTRDGRGGPGSAWGGTHLRDGRARCGKRTRDPGRYRAYGRDRSRGHGGRGPGFFDLAHHNAQGGERRSHARHLCSGGRALWLGPRVGRAGQRHLRVGSGGGRWGRCHRRSRRNGLDAALVRRNWPTGFLCHAAGGRRTHSLARSSRRVPEGRSRGGSGLSPDRWPTLWHVGGAPDRISPLPRSPDLRGINGPALRGKNRASG